MIQAIYYKEWHKSRWTLLVVFFLFAATIIYALINIAQSIRISGIDPVWDMIVQKGTYYFGYIKYLPLAAAVLLGITQYAPEMANKRLKLTLHLPLSENKIMLTMLSYGVGLLILTFILAYWAIFAGTRYYFPTEVAQWNTSITLPWFLAGLTGYLLTAWICIEPVWKQRIYNSLISLAILALFFFDVIPGAYTPSTGYLVAVTILTIGFSFLSLIRFKDGELF